MFVLSLNTHFFSWTPIPIYSCIIVSDASCLRIDTKYKANRKQKDKTNEQKKATNFKNIYYITILRKFTKRNSFN